MDTTRRRVHVHRELYKHASMNVVNKDFQTCEGGQGESTSVDVGARWML